MLVEVPRFHRRAARAPLRRRSTRPHAGAVPRPGWVLRLLRQALRRAAGVRVWSAGDADARAYPARHLFRFLANHGMLTLGGSPTWRTVRAARGRTSRRWRRPSATCVRRSAVVAVHRHEDGVDVRTADGTLTRFDAVVLATHADDALAILADASPQEKADLAAIEYSTNRTWLHRDGSVLPANPRARASWNYRKDTCDVDSSSVLVSYWMNRLHGLDTADDLVVTLNAQHRVDPELVVAEMTYEHPIFTPAAVAAARRLRTAGGDAWRSPARTSAGASTRTAPARASRRRAAWARRGDRHEQPDRAGHGRDAAALPSSAGTRPRGRLGQPYPAHAAGARVLLPALPVARRPGRPARGCAGRWPGSRGSTPRTTSTAAGSAVAHAATWSGSSSIAASRSPRTTGSSCWRTPACSGTPSTRCQRSGACDPTAPCVPSSSRSTTPTATGTPTSSTSTRPDAPPRTRSCTSRRSTTRPAPTGCASSCDPSGSPSRSACTATADASCDAGLTGVPAPLTTRTLLSTVARHALMTQRVTALIRVHGIWLWLRRLPVLPRPQHSPEAVR